MRYDELRDYFKQESPSNDIKMKYIYAQGKLINGVARYYIDGIEFLMIFSSGVHFVSDVMYSSEDINHISSLLQTPFSERLTEDMRHKQERMIQRA